MQAESERHQGEPSAVFTQLAALGVRADDEIVYLDEVLRQLREVGVDRAAALICHGGHDGHDVICVARNVSPRFRARLVELRAKAPEPADDARFRPVTERAPALETLLASEGIEAHSLVALRVGAWRLGELHLGCERAPAAASLSPAWIEAVAALVSLVVGHCARERQQRAQADSARWKRQFFDALLDSTHQGVVITREDSTIIVCNECAQRLLGAAGRSLIGERLGGRVPALAAALSREPRERGALEVDVPVAPTGERSRPEREGLRPDREGRPGTDPVGDPPATRRLHVSSPIWLEGGRRPTAVWLLQDVTARHQLQRDKERSEHRLREIFENLAAAILVVGLDGRILMTNSEARSLLQLPPRAEGTQLEHWVDRARQLIAPLPRGHQRTLELRRGDGRSLLLGYSSARVSMPEGQAVIILCRDIRPLKEAEDRRRRAEQLAQVGEMASRLSHEIKNPLSSVLAGLQVMQQARSSAAEAEVWAEDGAEAGAPGDGPEAQAGAATRRSAGAPAEGHGPGDGDGDRSVIESLIGEVGKIDRAVRGLLKQARPVSLRPKRVSASRLIYQALVSHMSLACAHEVLLELSPGDNTERGDETGLQVVADPVLLERLLSNLVINAVEACAGGGRVELGVRTVALDTRRRLLRDYPHPVAVLEVTDDGPGMSPEVQAQVFDPFFTTKGEGTGLGLATVKEMAEIHGGHVELRSAPGQGTTFRVYLPAGDRPPCWEARGCQRRAREEPCPAYGSAGGYCCWAVLGQASYAERGGWLDDCRQCPVFRRNNLQFWVS